MMYSSSESEKSFYLNIFNELVYIIHEYTMNHSKTKYQPYGGYSKKDRKKYLLKDNPHYLREIYIESQGLQFTRAQIYLYSLCESQKPASFKKNDYFEAITKLYETHTQSSPKVTSVKKIQAHFRKKLVLKRLRFQGPGFYNRSLCKNDEDFYTYEPKESIDPKYFFSYSDSQKNVWCFDIRSLKKLIEMNYGNPYTTETFSQGIRSQIQRFVNYLDETQVGTQIATVVVTNRRTAMKQRFVDLFAQIEYSGYSCSVDWILDLSPGRLKRFYKELEDLEL